MKINAKKTIQVDVTTIRVCAKVRDSGSYDLLDAEGGHVAGREDGYVPDFFPDQHYGDYLYLDIDLETGRITNWKKPTQGQIEDFIAKCKGETEDE